MSQLHFELRPSVLKLGLVVGLFIILSMVFSQYLAGVVMGLAMLSVLIVLYFLREKNPLHKLAQLDGKIWVLEFKDESKKHLTLTEVKGFGPCVFMNFLDTETNKIHKVCISKDQLDLANWQQLQSLVNLF